MIIGALGIGGSLIGLYYLDSRGVITVNSRAIYGVCIAGGLYVGYRFMTLLGIFI